MFASLRLSHFAARGRMNLLIQNHTDSFLCCPSISPLRARLLEVRDGCRVCILPNIRRKNRRDIDGTLGLSALRFKDIALCVAKPLEIPAVECRHTFNSLSRQVQAISRIKINRTRLTHSCFLKKRSIMSYM